MPFVLKRIYPVAIIHPTIAKAPIQVMGYEFQPEDILAPCIYPTHQREDLYPEPKQAKPTFPGTARLMNFSHLAVAIVAVLALPYLR